MKIIFKKLIFLYLFVFTLIKSNEFELVQENFKKVSETFYKKEEDYRKSLDELLKLYQDYLKKEKKSALCTTENEIKVFKTNIQDIIKKNIEETEKFNKNKNYFKTEYGVTDYTCMTSEQFKSSLNLKFIKEKPIATNIDRKNSVSTLADSRVSLANFDKKKKLRIKSKKNKVWNFENKKLTKNYNQGNCGNCWAFALLSIIEFYAKMEMNIDLELNVAELTFCAFQINNNNCDRGANYMTDKAAFMMKRLYNRNDIKAFPIFDYVDGDTIDEKDKMIDAKQKGCKALSNDNKIPYYTFDYTTKSIYQNPFKNFKEYYENSKKGPIAQSIILSDFGEIAIYDYQHFTNGYLKYKSCTPKERVERFFNYHMIVILSVDKYEDSNKNTYYVLTGMNSWKNWGQNYEGYTGLFKMGFYELESDYTYQSDSCHIFTRDTTKITRLTKFN